MKAQDHGLPLPLCVPHQHGATASLVLRNDDLHGQIGNERLNFDDLKKMILFSLIFHIITLYATHE